MKNILRKILYKKFSKTIATRRIASGMKYDLPAGIVTSHIIVKINFSLREGLYYSVRVANFGASRRTLRGAFMDVLEHETIGMAKYTRMKELLEFKKL